MFELDVSIPEHLVAVRDALAQTKDYVAVTGKITIDENRNANKSAVVLQISGAEFKYVKTVDPK